MLLKCSGVLLKCSGVLLKCNGVLLKCKGGLLKCSGVLLKCSGVLLKCSRVLLKCSGVLQCSDGLSNKVSNFIRRLMDNMKLLLICILRVLLSHSFIIFRFYFFINVYMVLFLFNNVIYAFLSLWPCILILCLCMANLTEVLTCFFLSCRTNARVKLAKTGHVPHSSRLVVICVVLLLFLCCSMHCLCINVYCTTATG